MNVLITGATSGIGKSIAELFAGHKYNVILTSRREDRITKICEELSRKHQIKATPLRFDVRYLKQATASIATLGENHEIDVLINNAGLAAGLSSIDKGEIRHWE